MRKGIDFVGVTVVFFCHDGKGNFLLSKRSNNCRDEKGNWDVGGGGVEVTDSVEQTLVKEIKEEYCVDVVSFEFLGFQDIFRDQEGQKTHWVALVYKVLVNPDGAKIGEPHKAEQLGWFTLDSLPHPPHSQLHKFVSIYRHRLIN